MSLIIAAADEKHKKESADARKKGKRSVSLLLSPHSVIQLFLFSTALCLLFPSFILCQLGDIDIDNASDTLVVEALQTTKLKPKLTLAELAAARNASKLAAQPTGSASVSSLGFVPYTKPLATTQQSNHPAGRPVSKLGALAATRKDATIASEKPISKLQQRMQSGGLSRPTVAPSAVAQFEPMPGQQEEKLPESSLFSLGNPILGAPSAFAHTLLPLERRPDNILPKFAGLSLENTFDTPSPDDIVNNARKGAINRHK